jgi:hypothetical protein
MIQVLSVCEDCGFEVMMSCEKAQQQLDHGKKVACKNKVMKLCLMCGINATKIYCYETNARCASQVTIELACGHSVRWKCGVDADPREISEYLCRGCVLPDWERSLNMPPPTDIAKDMFMLDMNGKIQTLLSECDALENLNFPVNLGSFMKARMASLTAFYDCMKLDEACEIRGSPPGFGSLEDLSNYHIVFIECRIKDKTGKVIINDEKRLKEIARRFSDGEGTIMGMGHRLPLLTSASVFEKLPGEDGRVKVCIGVAFAYREYHSTTPFRVGNAEKDKHKANQRAAQLLKKGYDFVAIDSSKCKIPAIDEHVYWQAGSVIPLCLVTLRVKVDCKLCLDSFSRAEGVFCSQAHFLCLDCFDEYVKSAQAPDAIHKLLDSEGNLKCPECRESYNPTRIAIQNPSALEPLMALRLKLHSEMKGNSSSSHSHVKSSITHIML